MLHPFHSFHLHPLISLPISRRRETLKKSKRSCVWVCINESIACKISYHLLGNGLGELVHAIRYQRTQGTFTSVLSQELFLDVLQECKGDPTAKGIVGHAHVGQSILADVVEQISMCFLLVWLVHAMKYVGLSPIVRDRGDGKRKDEHVSKTGIKKKRRGVRMNDRSVAAIEKHREGQ